MLGLLEYFWDWDGAPTPTTAVEIVIVDTRGYGSKGDTTYHPLPDSFWETRTKYMEVDKRKPSEVFVLADEPTPPNPVRDRKVSSLQKQKDLLAANLLAVPSLEHLKAKAAAMREIDDEIGALTPKLDLTT